MTFLQPFILWGLPLLLLPVLIHLINRMRHRRQQWAAMRFLLSATRSSISHAKLRQFLVLLFRVLAVLALILFLSRPLAGGWLGWAVASAPDAILILLDRSASMETQIIGAETTRREQAIKLLGDAAKGFAESSHIVLIDSARRTPQQIANISTLNEIPLTTPTDTAADLPAMMQAALQWLIENRAGTAEIWIASDLQQSNWLPEDSRWKSVVTRLASLPQKVRIRLLSFEQSAEANTSLSLKEMIRRQKGNQGELNFVLDLQRRTATKEPVPITMTLDGSSSQHELLMDGTALRWRHKASLDAKANGGWGSFTLPADANRLDNSVYFVYGAETPLRASVVAADAASARYFQLATAALTGTAFDLKDVVQPSAAAGAMWDQSSLLVWQGAFPDEATAERIRAFVQEGGAVIFFPPGNTDAQRFSGVAWSEVQTTEPEKSFHVLRWDEDQGPLAKTDEGITLPLSQTAFARRQSVIAPKDSLAVLAAFDDGAPFLARKTMGRGEAYFCASLPNREWSSLGDGPVLVPMVQRLLQIGSRRLQQAAQFTCGELSAAEQRSQWTSVDSTTPKDIQVHAGVYRTGERVAAVNRPAAEDEVEMLEADHAQQLFEGLPFQLFQERQGASDSLQGEVWRLLLIGMLVFLLVEGFLVLPTRGIGRGTQESRSVTLPKPEAVQA